MQLAAHEVHDLNELTLSCVNSITNMALFLDSIWSMQKYWCLYLAGLTVTLPNE